MTDERLLDASRRLTAALGPAGLDATLANITAAAVEVLPDVQLASITVRHADSRLEAYAPTDGLLCQLDAAQYELREGPCYEAATDAVHVTAPNLAADPRFPRYAPVAADRHVDNLEQAVRSRQLIGQAVGIVMERYRLDEARAFAVLTRLSQERNVKLRRIAQELVAERDVTG